MNYFELFKFPPTFDIDTAVLADRYRELQRAVHPDKFANDTEQQRLLSVQRTAQVNDGYQTLKDPIRRAEHMLSLRGIDLSHETTTVKDTAFLMQQMEWREALEDIRESIDHQAIINELYDSFAAYRLKLTKLLAAQLSSGSDEDALLAADQVRKLKFMAKLQDELTRIEDALLD
ncbi:co-chaperone HscB [Shewanella oneidensis MR-1]|uniref:Co-chaperone protein HscB homolog n=1 Tax=Shewanella oneidensis (strain ATCC 700550 / JCM 31522 / CIP 106686 / LMG 19005 / NCIMB 14063 / MR-1) TaxID=211586 RepID=HSCB_SHEON|nr:co-chaperone HscB [Shewanella oneidensis]Q8EEU6.1 RecName: Full=Co-chaperone protein HscB homolog [Shewanella oneidensis MR-1]AAN55307.1 co-chaperone Hsc20 HscB [Shewanella oneidensis MR-1]MDX5996024.1 co-chaperone HscB [Shewanella oneidensis]MEE2029271.1 Co-chaperone protein HscB [Shewanella oneidensis]QKG96835.1 co-chaperone HscB [Shewanella oneidensis MR-1]